MTRLIATLFACAALLAACDRDSPATKSGSATPPSSASSGASQTGSQTSSTPANAGTPSTEERREGANPTQQQVDPKEPAQHRDFQQKGDDQGPQSEETKPRS